MLNGPNSRCPVSRDAPNREPWMRTSEPAGPEVGESSVMTGERGAEGVAVTSADLELSAPRVFRDAMATK